MAAGGPGGRAMALGGPRGYWGGPLGCGGIMMAANASPSPQKVQNLAGPS